MVPTVPAKTKAKPPRMSGSLLFSGSTGSVGGAAGGSTRFLRFLRRFLFLSARDSEVPAPDAAAVN